MVKHSIKPVVQFNTMSSPYKYGTIVIEGITIVVMLWILSSLAFKLFYKANNINPWIRGINILCITIFLSVSSLDLSHIMLSEELDENLYDVANHFNAIRLSSDLLYFISSLLMYTIFIIKLYVMFSGTMYSVTYRFITVYAFMLSAFIICAILFERDFLFFHRVKANKVERDRLPYTVSLIFMDVLLNASICWLFIVKLKQIVLELAMDELRTSPRRPIIENFTNEQVKSRSKSFVDSLQSEINLDEYDDTKTKMLLIMTRLSILCTTQAVFNQFFLLLLVYIGFTKREDGDLLFSIVYAVRAVEMALNSVILYCNFEINKKCYQCLCGYCNGVCYGFCVQKTIGTLIDKLEKQNPLMTPLNN